MKHHKRMDDLSRLRAEHLAMFGFSHRAIAEIALGIPKNSTSDESVKARQAVACHLSRRGIRLREWRDAESELAQKIAYRAAQAGKHKRRRAIRHRRAG